MQRTTSTVYSMELRGFPGNRKALEWLHTRKLFYVIILHWESQTARVKTEEDAHHLDEKIKRLWKAFYGLFKIKFTPHKALFEFDAESTDFAEEALKRYMNAVHAFDYEANEHVSRLNT